MAENLCRARAFFQLHCFTCNETFKPIVATVAGELNAPDYDGLERDMGPLFADKLREFHRQHGLGHDTREIQC